MRRALPTILFAIAGLATLQWRGVRYVLFFAPRGSITCGNAVTDPYMAVVNVLVPVAAACAGVTAWECLKARRWGCREVAGLFAFAATAAGLLYEGRSLVHDYGFELGRIWWMPWG